MDRPRLSCLTLHRPWGWTFIDSTKRIENRKQPCRFQKGHYIALHHGKTWDKNGARKIEEITGTRIFNYQFEPFEIVAIARFDHCESWTKRRGQEEPWFFGPYGYHLKNIVKIDPVKNIKGMQGFWYLPDDRMDEVQDKYRKARYEILNSERAQEFLSYENSLEPWLQRIFDKKKLSTV